MHTVSADTNTWPPTGMDSLVFKPEDPYKWMGIPTSPPVTTTGPTPEPQAKKAKRPVRVLFARFPYGRSEDPDVTNWLVKTALECETDPEGRIEEQSHTYRDGTPITALRNEIVKLARTEGYDLVVMVDNDMHPDCESGEGVRPFWGSTFDYWWEHHHPDVSDVPCVIGAPYCGPPPNSLVYVLDWTQTTNDPADNAMKLSLIDRDCAIYRKGITPVAALPTGCIMYDVRCFNYLPPPYFYYEYGDVECSVRISTEDITNTRDLTLAVVGEDFEKPVQVLCNWDSWAGHHKLYEVRKPKPILPKYVPKKFRDMVVRQIKQGQLNKPDGVGRDV